MPPMHKPIPVVFLGIALLAGAAFAAEPALPRKGGAPVVYQCPLTNLVVNGESVSYPAPNTWMALPGKLSQSAACASDLAGRILREHSSDVARSYWEMQPTPDVACLLTM